jgi:SfnB family sulfur acquisition oxidoreductase
MSTDAVAVPTARVVADDAEALEVARSYAASIAPGAAARDRDRAIPVAELEELGRSGLLGITVPREFGGADVAHETVGEVFRIISAADPAIGQVPQNHFVFVEVVRQDGSPEQQAFFFAEVLAGARFGNALSERGTKNVFDLKTRLAADGDGGLRLDGRKYYTTGALTAQWIPVFALDADDRLVVAYVERGADGVEVLEDWTAMGQRATWSGTTILSGVRVPREHVVEHWRTYERPQLFGAFGQLMHAAIDVGIAENALADAATFVRTRSRAWFESPFDRASEDPVIIQGFGVLAVRLHAAQELLRKAGRTLDAARPAVDEDSAAAASLAVAEAKAFAGDVAVAIASELFELAGTSATDEEHNLHRHWRNARTHTLHDPNRWKYHHAGNFVLNGVRPPNHGLL